MTLTTEEIETRVDLNDYDPNLDLNDEYGEEYRRYKTYGEDLAEVQAAHPNHVWTCISCDCDCEPCETCLGADQDNSDECGCMDDCNDNCQPLRIIAGFHYVNREYYIITHKPWVTGDEWE
jgi:hypothetical protein